MTSAETTPAWLDFGRGLCADLPSCQRREWLATNGIGGYASGTVAGLLTRRYHGLLVAALHPPLGRTLLLAKLAEDVDYRGQSYALSVDRWAHSEADPSPLRFLERFRLEGLTPVWTYALGDALVEKRVWMQRDANTTFVRYDILRASAPLRLRARALVNYREYHGNTRAGDWTMDVSAVADGLRIQAFAGAAPLFLRSATARATPQHEWYRDFHLDVEAYRGLEPVEDHLCAGCFEAELDPQTPLTLVASTAGDSRLDGAEALDAHRAYETRLARASGFEGTPVAPLALAADQFVVRRPLADGSLGHTILAGYPWFGDWGRDTMISLPGLTLATGRGAIAAAILRTFATYVDGGMLPNRFPDSGEQPDYNTADATLWMFEAARACYESTGDGSLLRELFPVLDDIVRWHVRGTRFGIGMDPADGLLRCGEPGSQLTWMDARVGDWVVTPRIGKPVEINALWYNALSTLAELAPRVGAEATAYAEMAARTRRGFERFWNAGGDCCFDVVDGPAGDDDSLRPNQLLAVSLHHSPLSPARQRAVVDACSRELLTSHGLRSLAPGDAEYVGTYGGDQVQRDGAYHRGTVWGWLIGPFLSAHWRVYGDAAQVRQMLRPLIQHLDDTCLGSLSEIFDGDPPFTPRGCFAQAWSVAEALRVWRQTQP